MIQEPSFYNKETHFYTEAPKHLLGEAVNQYDEIIDKQKKYSQLSREEFQ